MKTEKNELKYRFTNDVLFKMETEEDLQRIKDMEVPIMSQAIMAYQHVSTSRELDEINRMLEKAERDEASRMYYAEKRAAEKAAERERAKWERRVAEIEAENARLRAQLATRPDA